MARLIERVSDLDDQTRMGRYRAIVESLSTRPVDADPATFEPAVEENGRVLARRLPVH